MAAEFPVTVGEAAPHDVSASPASSSAAGTQAVAAHDVRLLRVRSNHCALPSSVLS